LAKLQLRAGCSGAVAAQAVLTTAGVRGVRIEHHQACLMDYYDPLFKILRLSPEVFAGRSIASLAVATHEAGHAIQHKVGDARLKWRSLLLPFCHLGNLLWFWPVLAGMLLRQLAVAPLLLWMGIGVLSAVVSVELLTLPTEWNASQRAKAVLVPSGLVANRDETAGMKRVLDAAAFRCLAATVVVVLHVPRVLVRPFRP
jgi:Zn-dependent membrane protease YugP